MKSLDELIAEDKSKKKFTKNQNKFHHKDISKNRKFNPKNTNFHQKKDYNNSKAKFVKPY